MSFSQGEPDFSKGDAKAEKARVKTLRPWYKKKRFVIPISYFVITGIAGGISGVVNGQSASTDTSGSTTTNSATLEPESTATQNEEAVRPTIGSSALSGDLSISLTDLVCGIKSVGSDWIGDEAQGQYCKVSLKVENVGDEEVTMRASQQKLFDSSGREFSYTTSTVFLDGGITNEDINPGNTLEGSILFDVPTDVSLDYIVLTDGSIFGGVEFSLK